VPLRSEFELSPPFTVHSRIRGFADSWRPVEVLIKSTYNQIMSGSGKVPSRFSGTSELLVGFSKLDDCCVRSRSCESIAQSINLSQIVWARGLLPTVTSNITLSNWDINSIRRLSCIASEEAGISNLVPESKYGREYWKTTLSFRTAFLRKTRSYRMHPMAQMSTLFVYVP